MSISAGPYEVDSEKTHGVRGITKFYNLTSANGKVIADSLNSEDQEIFEEDGERWDEQGRQNFNAIANACNCHADFLALAEAVIVEAKYLPHLLGELGTQAEAALAKAESGVPS